MFDQIERERILRNLKKQEAYHRANPAAARAFLLSTGIYTPDGELAPEYRSDDPEEEESQPQSTR
ncbi:MAG: hypothetical protein FWD68_19425 [Alphaproteobacteria bacterium]|nr:hypothetical protein [Alphaproteobacteria bacterium]